MDIKNLKLANLVTKPITVSPNTTLTKTREILLENKVKRVIIIDKKKAVGVITEKDIAKKIYELGTKSIKSVKAKEFKPKILFTLTKGNSVQDCAKMMKKHRISLVIIRDKKEILEGIITKTDLATVFLTKESMPIQVSKIMEKKIITAAPSDPILHVESLLIRYGISRVIIKRNQRPVGIITFRDFVPAKIPQWIAESADPKEIQEYKFKKGLEESHSNQMSYLFPFHATDIMTSNPIIIEMEKDVKVAITLMIKHNISGLPVVKKSKLVGIVTKSDIVKTLAE
ncbi:MAG: CBS domain-containing protein [Nitrosopumilus sp.]